MAKTAKPYKENRTLVKFAKRLKPNNGSVQRLAQERDTQEAVLAPYQLPPYRKGADSPETYAQLLCTTTSTPMTQDQYRRVFRVGRRVGNLLSALVGISYLLLLGWVISYTWDTASLLTNVLLYAVAFIAAVIPISRQWVRSPRGRYEAARCKGDAADAVIEIYQDRAVKTSVRGHTVIYFREADGLYEWRDMLCLRVDRHVIAWRAADLTNAQVALIRKLVYARIDRNRRVFYGRLQPRRDLVRPLPETVAMPDGIRMIYQPKKLTFKEKVRRRQQELVLPTVSATLVVTLIIASLFEISGIHLIDIALFFNN